MTATPIMGTQAVAQPQSQPVPSILEAVLLKGDLSKLTPTECVQYILEVCRSLGLNPATRPFEFMDLGGKRVLYAKRDAADQLRKIHGISLKITSAKINDDGIYIVEAEAKAPDGRTDMDVGAVPLADSVKGEFRANLILKAVTKAKRRVTLSICGLGFLDETEVEDIPQAAQQKGAAEMATKPLAQNFDNDSIEDQVPSQDDIDLLKSLAREAARGGETKFTEFYHSYRKQPASQAILRAMKPELVALYPK